MTTDSNDSPMLPAVVRDEAGAAFFDAAARGELLVKKGPGGVVLGPEVRTCPVTGSGELDAVSASGRATLVSWATVHRAPLPILADAVPYVTALVELDEGPWLLVRLIDVDTADLRVGLPLLARYVTGRGADGEAAGETLPVFAPDPGRR
ncbi:Zn-ribbon domain-containing OB-fold protein [Gordonia humi]|uniref:ChsH2 C-terminal OB-fold domain-containing protein n=1 Tax=Gordonia humi TaxID=686429 RepID=A0A840F0N4_9ACTN|nr:OB-fold domain-containing protein [Gordonia humi]MBB4137432.1 hypothetical protein [Gordonia humi]